MKRPPVFRSAISDGNGDVDAGYLALFWIMAVVITAIPFMCVFAAIAMAIDPLHKFDVQSLGIGIGSVCGGFGVAVGAVGAFRAGDKPRAETAGFVTTTTQDRTTVQTQSPAVLANGTANAPVPVVVKNSEPVDVHVKKPRKR